MLIHGYENVELSCCCMNLKLDISWVSPEVCDMVGNELKPKPAAAAVGKDISVSSKLFCQANMFSKLTRELFWNNCGNPHDMGSSAACAGVASRANSMSITTSARINFSLIRLSSKYSLTRRRLIRSSTD